MPKTLVVLLGVVFFVASSAVASIPDELGIFHACVAKESGQVRIIDTSIESCKNNETSKTWSMIGPVGPAGPASPTPFRLIDSVGQTIGTIDAGENVLRVVDGIAFRMRVALEGYFSGMYITLYASSNCTGQAYMGVDTNGRVVQGYKIGNAVVYSPVEDSTYLAVNSTGVINEDGHLSGCTAQPPGVVFISAAPPRSLTLPVFVRPFHVE